VRGSHVPLPQKNAYGMVVRQPIGICGGIVPWNFPLTLMGTKLGPALAAGNTIIIKPASTTPLATIRVIELICQASFGEGKAQKTLPKGTVNIVTGPGGSVGEELLRNPRVRRIAFTGSTPIGRHVMEVAGREIKRITLELGGSDPMIVMDDANLDLAVKMADVGRYFNCGQMCLGVKRLFLQESVADNFIGGLVEILKKKTVGNGMSKETRMGPIHTGAQRQEVEEQVEDAKARGAKTLFGGERPNGGDFDKGFFYLPTLMSNVADDARMTREEVFGPALPVYTFKTLDEALEKANASEFGLGSSIWTRNLLNANKAIDKLQAGNVWVNSLHYGYDELPFGGIKSSGVGREHGPEALDYYLEPKGVVVVNV
jgi:succinate-semialdehyde dehydrogenase/glutarate-semialdehyde dehydrogenase